MKLASLKGGEDGRLVVVSNDLAWFTEAGHIAPTLKAALEDWERCEPELRGLAECLAHGSVPKDRFHEHDAESPLPRAPKGQDGAEGFRAPRAPIPLGAAQGLDLSAGVVVVTGEAPMGVGPAEASAAIRLVMLCLRHATPGEAAKPASSFSPVAVTPDALEGWREGRLTGRLEMELNGRPVAEPAERAFDFAALVADAARTRALQVGSIVGAGDGAPRPPALKVGDVGRIEMRDTRRHSIFGAIEQAVAPA